MYVCILRQGGEVVLHRNMPASPEAVLKALASSRDAMVIAVDGLCPWYGRADRCAQAGLPFVRGHALSRQAIHGGQAQTDPSASQHLAGLLRGGRLPPASVSPAAMQATRDLRRRRMPRMRQRAALLAHLPHPNSPSQLPAIGKQLASKGHRDGVAARFLAPAVPKRGEVALARMDHDERLRHDGARTIAQTAKPHQAHALSRRPSVPGLGTMGRWVWRSAMPASPRCPRGQDVVSSCRLVQCAKASAGKRDGTSGQKLGHASLKGALSAAAGLFLRPNAQGQPCLARWEHTQGQG